MLLVVIHWRGEQNYLNINQANNVIMPYRLQDRYLRFQIFKELSCQFLFQDGLDCDRSIRCLWWTPPPNKSVNARAPRWWQSCVTWHMLSIWNGTIYLVYCFKHSCEWPLANLWADEIVTNDGCWSIGWCWIGLFVTTVISSRYWRVCIGHVERISNITVLNEQNQWRYNAIRMENKR